MWGSGLIFFLSLRSSDLPKAMQHAFNKGAVVVDGTALDSACSFSDNLFPGASKHQDSCAHKNRHHQPCTKAEQKHSDTPLHFSVPKTPLSSFS